ncbi:hypothetical protein NDU88_004699 [Pleurodeles waltl]|uniref:Uncharacterized protein n=1 Tax=Pleurodeles waltl TaxID=8319 RepID=A0AAV7NT76_PLEWA|nr:hypothetical protein NDU88_004699 [Pleurodeles waltl]
MDGRFASHCRGVLTPPRRPAHPLALFTPLQRPNPGLGGPAPSARPGPGQKLCPDGTAARRSPRVLSPTPLGRVRSTAPLESRATSPRLQQQGPPSLEPHPLPLLRPAGRIGCSQAGPTTRAPGLCSTLRASLGLPRRPRLESSQGSRDPAPPPAPTGSTRGTLAGGPGLGSICQNIGRPLRSRQIMHPPSWPV